MLLRQIVNKVVNLPVRCSSTSSIRNDSNCTSSVTNDSNVAPFINNRNPRNLEKMRIGYKPAGFYLEKAERKFWHKLVLDKKMKCVTAKVVHFERGNVITASTTEWCVKKHLYRYTDTSAYQNLGKILAERCLMAGITEVQCFIKAVEGGKVQEFLNSIKEGGISLCEPSQFKMRHPSDHLRPEKPWEVTE